MTLEKGLFTTYTYSSPLGKPRRTREKCDEDSDDTDYGCDSDDEADDAESIDAKFSMDLRSVVESLSLVNRTQVSTTHCTMIYQGYGHPFVLVFEDSKITERCEFATYVNLDLDPDNYGFDLNQEEILLEGIIKADVLYDALKDLKDINTEEIFIYASTRDKTNNVRENVLAIVAKSEMGISTFNLPNDRSILEKLHIKSSEKVDVSCYNGILFCLVTRAMKLSSKCKFKRDESLLSINMLSTYGNDIPKDYYGTVFEFKLLQQMSDWLGTIEDYMKDHSLNQPGPQHIGQVHNQGQHFEELEQDDDDDGVAIDVPVFL